MTAAPTLEDVFNVMSAASFGEPDARVGLPEAPQMDDVPTRLAIGLNVLLDDLATRARTATLAAERLNVLASAAHEFAANTYDLDRLLDTIARRLTEVVKDLCTVLTVSEDGTELVPVALHAVTDEDERHARSMFCEPLLFERHPIARRVHESGEPFIMEKIDLEVFRAVTTPKYFKHASASGMHSMLVVPLRVQGVMFGQLALVRFRDKTPSFDKDDLVLVQGLADHAALAIANAQSLANERQARIAAEAAKDEQLASERRYRSLFDNSPLAKWVFDAETLRFRAVNEAAIREYGYSRDEFLAMTIKQVCPAEELEALLTAIDATGSCSEPNTAPQSPTVWNLRKKNGERMSVEIIHHTLTLGERVCRMAVLRNVTERRRLEEQLRQSQKMDAIGRLAGGIAHDFNNVLSVILSYGEMMLSNMKPGEPMREDVEEIRSAARRAADLTKQLLMFSRKQVVEPKVVNLNELLAGMDKMLQRILGADMDLVSIPFSGLGRVRIDPSSAEQIIMNLVVNARDAMPRGGKLTMETANVTLDEMYARTHLDVTPGQYVMLAVTDNGVGMDSATVARIFEPFFTTKASGKGTGLGLATVFGIVKQSGGSVWVYSEVGKGTTFKVYLPRVDSEIDVIRAAEPIATVRGTETVLLVEDNEQVRVLARTILRKSGYLVIEARNAGEALLHAEKHPGTIHILLSDVVMPQMSGPELAHRLASVRPSMKVLCMSGYTDDAIVRHGIIEEQIAYLQKPFTPETLTMKMREVLDDARRKNG